MKEKTWRSPKIKINIKNQSDKNWRAHYWGLFCLLVSWHSLKTIQCGSQLSSHPKVLMFSWKIFQHSHRWQPQFTSRHISEFSDFNSKDLILRKTHWLKLPCWPGTMVTIRISYFMTGGSSKKYRTNKPQSTGRVQERSKGGAMCPTTSQNPPC